MSNCGCKIVWKIEGFSVKLDSSACLMTRNPPQQGNALEAVLLAQETINEWKKDTHGRVHVHTDVISKAVNAAIWLLQNGSACPPKLRRGDVGERRKQPTTPESLPRPSQRVLPDRRINWQIKYEEQIELQEYVGKKIDEEIDKRCDAEAKYEEMRRVAGELAKALTWFHKLEPNYKGRNCWACTPLADLAALESAAPVGEPKCRCATEPSPATCPVHSEPLYRESPSPSTVELETNDFTTDELKRHACGCEVCARSSIPCPATASSILLERQGELRKKLEEIKDAAAKATAGEWRQSDEIDGHNRSTRIIADVPNIGVRVVARTDSHYGRPHVQEEAANARFIAKSRDWIPWLVEQLEKRMGGE